MKNLSEFGLIILVAFICFPLKAFDCQKPSKELGLIFSNGMFNEKSDAWGAAEVLTPKATSMQTNPMSI